MLILVAFLVFLFSMYLYVREDFILLRKNTSIETVFNMVFLTAVVSFLSARLVFVLTHFKPGYLNPLIFFLVPYFPGLSLVGGVIGACLFLFLSMQRRKMPLGRLFDMFSLAFLISFSVFTLFQSALSFVARQSTTAYIQAGVFVCLFFFVFLTNRIFGRSRWKDGSIALVNLFGFCSLLTLQKVAYLFVARHIIFDTELPVLLVFFLGLLLVAIFTKRGVGRKTS